MDSDMVFWFASFVVGMGTGWYMGLNYGRVEVSREMVESYKMLLQYGRVEKPVAVVRDAPPDAETIAMLQISDTAHANLAEYLAQEAGVSTERAREEAERMLANFETTGTIDY